MKTQECIGCGDPFEPGRKGQQFCSTACGNRQRDRRRRERLGAKSASTARSTVRAAETRSSFEWAKSRHQFGEELARQREALERRRLVDVADCERHLDRLQSELRMLASNFDQVCGEQGELRALNVELEQEVRRLRQSQREDALDLMFLATRIVMAPGDTGFQVDERTKALFHRRGWSLHVLQRQGQPA